MSNLVDEFGQIEEECFTEKHLLERGARPLSELSPGQFAGYLYIDGEGGMREIYEPFGSPGNNFVLRNSFTPQ